ncbi:MAG: hypothetical protein QM784_07440 [Polyangiaceae bacterium]
MTRADAARKRDGVLDAETVAKTPSWRSSVVVTPHRQLSLAAEQRADRCPIPIGSSTASVVVTPHRQLSLAAEQRTDRCPIPIGSSTATSVAIDCLQRKNVAPVVAPNATVDFDDGFVPPETTGG